MKTLEKEMKTIKEKKNEEFKYKFYVKSSENHEYNASVKMLFKKEVSHVELKSYFDAMRRKIFTC